MLAWIRRNWPWLDFREPLTIELRSPADNALSRVIDEHTLDFVAYLANPWDQLPETARLTWLACCARALAESTLLQASLIPLALHSAQFVELLPDGDAVLEVAMNQWLPEGLISPAAMRTWWVTEGHVGFPSREAWRRSVDGALLT